ncbi:MAG: hemolysin III family protein [Bacteroidota bacterium]
MAVDPLPTAVFAIPGFCQPVSSLSHLAAAGAACVFALPLLRLGRRRGGHRTAIAVYVACVIAVLVVSGTYHSLNRGGSARAMMQQVDYYAIWLLIAGTFTAVHGIMCRGFWRRGVLTFVWGYAAVGISLQVIWFDIFSGVPGLIMYLGLGWVGIASVIKLGRQIGFRAVRPLWTAGIAFSAGAILEAVQQPNLMRGWIGPHEIFHLAVILGVAMHWLFIRGLLLNHVQMNVQVAPDAAPVVVPAC